MSSKPVKVGICGLGTVGSGTFNVLTRNAQSIAARAQSTIEIAHVGARRDNPACELGDTRVSRDIFEVARDPEIDVLVELIGGTTVARDLVTEAVNNGKHVVTANKALLAKHGVELAEIAESKGLLLNYESAVAGGIPIIKVMRESLTANTVTRISGILNGTCNYILTNFCQNFFIFKIYVDSASKSNHSYSVSLL